MEKVFENKASAVAAVQMEHVWSFAYKNVDTEGNVSEIFRCNKVKKRGEQCAAGVYLHYPSITSEVHLYRSQLAHTCNVIVTRVKSKMSNEVKEEIKSLFNFDSKIKPKKILDILIKKQVTLPSKTELNNYLSSLRKVKYGSNVMSLGELENFCLQNSKVPDDVDAAFVVSYQVVYEEQPFFRFFVSTKTLLKLSCDANHIHADATYKLVWQGFPVLLLGTTDRDRVFHVFGLSVCSKEQTEDFIFLFKTIKSADQDIFQKSIAPKYLVCDAAKSIQNAFINVFGSDVTIIMCWAHMKKCVQKKAEQLVHPKEKRNEILKDIDLLQQKFMEYFQHEWLECNPNWFEGVSKLVPSTNNALESFNRVIKDENTLRERLPLSRFAVVLKEYINTVHCKCKNNACSSYAKLRFMDQSLSMG